MGDVDLLIERRHFRKAHELVLDLGFEFRLRNTLSGDGVDFAERAGGGEYTRQIADGRPFWLELQWRSVAGKWIRPDQEPKTEELLARSIPIDGTSLRLLSPEDNLLQVALHTAKHSYVRAPGLRLHLDVDRIVRSQAVDWELFAARVSRLRVQTAVFFSLAVPARLFGTPVPAWVLARLRPNPVRGAIISSWLARITPFHEGKAKFGNAGYVLFTSLLYDNVAGLFGAMFPRREWMREQYPLLGPAALGRAYVQRLWKVLFLRSI
jgi:hypothetical protein